MQNIFDKENNIFVTNASINLQSFADSCLNDYDLSSSMLDKIEDRWKRWWQICCSLYQKCSAKSAIEIGQFNVENCIFFMIIWTHNRLKTVFLWFCFTLISTDLKNFSLQWARSFFTFIIFTSRKNFINSWLTRVYLEFVGTLTPSDLLTNIEKSVQYLDQRVRLRNVNENLSKAAIWIILNAGKLVLAPHLQQKSY